MQVKNWHQIDGSKTQEIGDELAKLGLELLEIEQTAYGSISSFVIGAKGRSMKIGGGPSLSRQKAQTEERYRVFGTVSGYLISRDFPKSEKGYDEADDFRCSMDRARLEDEKALKLEEVSVELAQ